MSHFATCDVSEAYDFFEERNFIFREKNHRKHQQVQFLRISAEKFTSLK